MSPTDKSGSDNQVRLIEYKNKWIPASEFYDICRWTFVVTFQNLYLEKFTEKFCSVISQEAGQNICKDLLFKIVELSFYRVYETALKKYPKGYEMHEFQWEFANSFSEKAEKEIRCYICYLFGNDEEGYKSVNQKDLHIKVYAEMYKHAVDGAMQKVTNDVDGP